VNAGRFVNGFRLRLANYFTLRVNLRPAVADFVWNPARRRV
jgi:hypothetical protein